VGMAGTSPAMTELAAARGGTRLFGGGPWRGPVVGGGPWRDPVVGGGPVALTQ
jgi:hypothetical protein